MAVKPLSALIITCLCLAVSTGCTGLQVKRGVAGNTLYSSSRPRLNVEVGPDFKFLKEEKSQKSHFASHSDSSANIEKEVYRFWDEEKQREVQVHFHRINKQRTYWNRFDFKKMPNLIDAGEETIRGDVYQYGVYTVSNRNGSFLVKAIGRRIGGQSDTKMLLYYAERVGGQAAIDAWKHSETLSSENRKRLKRFLEHFESDVRIGDYEDKGA